MFTDSVYQLFLDFLGSAHHRNIQNIFILFQKLFNQIQNYTDHLAEVLRNIKPLPKTCKDQPSPP